jgi:hypothetical protein
MPYNIGGSTIVGNIDFLREKVDALPAPYLVYREFWERMFLPSAEYLAFVYSFWKNLYTYLTPATAPEEWVDWMLTEWMGWTLIPDGYPLSRKRRLLENLASYYKTRSTPRGIEALLREFGIVANVYDRPMYWGSYYGDYGVEPWPLHVRIRIKGYEPFFSPKRTYWGGYLGGDYYHEVTQILTDEFVVALCRWSRAAGTRMLIEWVTRARNLFVGDETDNEDLVSDSEPVWGEPLFGGSTFGEN